MNQLFGMEYQENIKPKEPKIEKLVQEIENAKFSEDEVEDFQPPISDDMFSEATFSENFPHPLETLKECLQEKLAIKALADSFKRKTNRVLTLLSAREERIIRMRFGIGMVSDHTWEEIAQQFSFTKERIEQIAHRALKKLNYWS